jgi:hypothetical protein
MSKDLSDKKYTAIPENAVIKIDVSGQYYADLKMLFNGYLIEDEDKESTGKILDNITTGKITSLKEHRLYAMLVLIYGIEEAAKEQGVTEMKPFVPPTSTSPQD